MTFGINLRKNVQDCKVKPAKYVKRSQIYNKWGKEIMQNVNKQYSTE